MKPTEYWEETLSDAAQECGLTLTPEQLTALAEAAQSAHECYGMAFYTPPSSDRIAVIERECKQKVESARAEANRMRDNFVKNVCKRRGVRPDQVEIGDNGDVTYFR